jgi:putative chitinase
MSEHTISPNALQHVCPNLKQADAARIAAGLGEAFHRFGIDTERRAAMAVAQWAHESDRFRTSQEYASGSAYEGRSNLGNIRPGDGRRFKGRGRIMVTGRANYAAMSKALGIDLVGQPELLAQSPTSELASGQWWKDHDCNSFCDRDDFVGLTRRINGGVNGLAERQVARDLVPRDRWSALTKEERAQMDVLASERRIAQRNGGWDNVDRSHLEAAKTAKAWLAERSKELARLAKAEPKGWEKAGRRERYDLIKRAIDG